jgi:hypothetical protein
MTQKFSNLKNSWLQRPRVSVSECRTPHSYGMFNKNRGNISLGLASILSAIWLAICGIIYFGVHTMAQEQLSTILPGVARDKILTLLIVVAIVVVLGLFISAMRLNTRSPKQMVGNPEHADDLMRDSTTVSFVSQRRFPRYAEAVDFNYGLLRSMEWRRFEIVCAEYLRSMGYEVMETGFGDRNGVDLEVFLPGKPQLFNIVACLSDREKTGERAIAEFVDAMQRSEVSEGMIFSVRGFDAKAIKFAARYRIALVDGETLCNRVGGFDLEHRHSMIVVAIEGDYTTPTCPNCGVRLVMRRRKNSRTAADEFWGCVNYPACKVTRAAG